MKIVKIGIIAILAMTFSLHCGDKEDGMLLLPLTGDASGGPGVSPEEPAPAATESETLTGTEVTAEDEDNTSGDDNGSTGDDNGSTGDDNGSTGDDNGSTGDDNGSTGDDNGSTGDEDNDPIDDEEGDDVDDGEDDADGSNDDDSGDSDDGSDDDGDSDDTDDQSGDSGSDDGAGDDEGGVNDGGSAVECSNRSVELDTSKGRWFKTDEAVLPGKKLNKGQKNAIRKQIRAHRKTIKSLRGAIKSGGNKTALKANISRLKAKIADLRAELGFGNTRKGIHTYWANQKLYLRVKNNCKAGYYKLKIVAKNIHGPLPDFYKKFSLSVKNETTGHIAQGMFIKAQDERYRRGRVLVYIGEGDSNILILWKNDAWKKGVYDANIQIKKVKLKYKRYVRQRSKMARKATQYCYTKGRWFWDAKTARTYWANQTIGYCFKNLKPGKYKVQVRAKNYGKVPAGYTDFNVVAAADGVSGRLNIKADTKKYHKGSTILDITDSSPMVLLTWTNDKWVPSKGEDANIQIRRVKLIRVGDSERSALAAFIMSAAKGNNAMILITLMIAVIGLLGVMLWSKFHPNKGNI